MFYIANTLRDGQQLSKTVAVFETEEQANHMFEKLVRDTYGDLGNPSDELDFTKRIEERDGGCFILVDTTTPNHTTYRNAILENDSNNFGQYITMYEYNFGNFV